MYCFFVRTCRVSRVIPVACCTAFAKRFRRTCSMRTESIGMEIKSFGIETLIFKCGYLRLKSTITVSISSSRTTGTFCRRTPFVPSIFVTERRFSTIRISHWESSRIPVNNSSVRSCDSLFLSFSSTSLEPYMVVSGVRRS